MPAAPPGGVLVRTTHSVISIGTEKMKVEQARMNLLQKARARPDQVRKVLDTARNLGWRSALEKVRNRLETPTPLGYSAAGVVAEVDPANTRFRVGDRVACAGAECAFHAEYLALPDLLAAPVPPEVESWQAAYTTLCAIALQAVRQSETVLGERVLVLGQGLIGLLVTNVLCAAGVRVMAADVQSSRRAMAEAMGAEKMIVQGEQNLADEVRAWTEGFGMDAVIVCTATQSNAPIEQAADVLRDRGRLIIVGNTKIELLWKTFYEKEIDVRFSRSYGPGRYDPNYEWGGTDYPIGYVRWTEQRNFQACLDLMAKGKMNLAALTTRRVAFTDVLKVYEELATNSAKDIGVILEYPDVTLDKVGRVPTPTPQKPADGAHGVTRPTASAPGESGLRLAKPVAALDVIGAGNFARTMLLPHLKDKIPFGTVVNQTALSANHVKTKFGFREAATDAAKAFEGGENHAVLIATRHQMHAALVQQALKAHRHVFVEKPLCLSREELKSIDAAIAQSRGTVQVGFNRRFAPATVELQRLLANVAGPKSISYRVLAGKLDPNHWYANFAESGGRVLGEACHFLDFFCFLLGQPKRVLAQPTWPAAGRLPFADSVTAQVEFSDGSSAQLIYTAEGDPKYPKETVTVFGAGLTAEIVNFQELTVYRNRKESKHSCTSKGHAEQMNAWAEFLQGKRDHPLPYVQARTSMLLTFAVLDSIQRATSVDLA